MTYIHRNEDTVVEELFSTSDRRGKDNMPILLRRGDRRTLADVTRVLGYKTGVEIGTRKGDYAVDICERNPDMHLYCVDPWMTYSRIPQRQQDRFFNVASSRLAKYNVTIVRKPSLEAVSDFKDESIDFVFIDGAHDFDNVMCDLIYWARKVKKLGIVALHDYRSGQWAGVVPAVDAYTKCHSIMPWYVTREMEPTAFWFKSTLPELNLKKRFDLDGRLLR